MARTFGGLLPGRKTKRFRRASTLLCLLSLDCVLWAGGVTLCFEMKRLHESQQAVERTRRVLEQGRKQRSKQASKQARKEGRGHTLESCPCSRETFLWSDAAHLRRTREAAPDSPKPQTRPNRSLRVRPDRSSSGPSGSVAGAERSVVHWSPLVFMSTLRCQRSSLTGLDGRWFLGLIGVSPGHQHMRPGKATLRGVRTPNINWTLREK